MLVFLYNPTYIHTKTSIIVNNNNNNLLIQPSLSPPLLSPPLPTNANLTKHPPHFLSKFPCKVCCLIPKLANAANPANPNAATHTPLKLST